MFDKYRKIIFTWLLFVFFTPTNIFAFDLRVSGVHLNKEVKPLKEINRKHIVAQSMAYSCGPAVIATLLNYYLNDKTTEKEIIDTLSKTVPNEKIIRDRGYSLLELKKFTQSKGYNVTAYRMTMKALSELKGPAVVPIKFRSLSHYVIVKGIVGDRVFLADPVRGNITMKITKFKDVWLKSIAMIVELNKNDKKQLVSYLKVNDNDVIIADYKMIRRLTEGTVFRTAIFPGEF